MPPPRTLKPLLLIALAVALAIWAQNQLTSAFRGDGVVAYLVAIGIFLAASRRTALARLGCEQSQPADAAFLPEKLNGFRVALLAASIVATFMGLYLFSTPNNQPIAWYFHLVSVVLFGATFFQWRSKTTTPITSLPVSTSALSSSRSPKVLLLFILLIAALARMWQLEDVPFGVWYDEAFNGNLAVQMLNESAFRPVFFPSDTLPSHLAYLFALSFRLFGVSAFSLRLVTALFGVATVLLAYLLFRRWFGERIGLVAAACFAVMRYNLTFSRIAMHGITTPAFELLVLWLFDRALTSRRLSDFAWAGLALGFGLAFYTPFRIFPLVLIAFFVALLLRVRGWRLLQSSANDADIGGWALRHGKHAATLWLVLLLGMSIAIAPVVHFAFTNSEVFLSRTSNVSLFEKHDEPDIVKAVFNNVVKHLLMFNLQGDRNGRHNLPNAPMLDPLMGALFVLGVAHALWRWRDPANALMLLIFFTLNLGGILSVDFEAPQSLRSIGVMPALAYFTLLPFAAFSHELSRLFRRGQTYRTLDAGRRTPAFAPHLPSPLPRPPSPAFWKLDKGLWSFAFALFFIVSAYLNFDTYFNRQRNTPEVWAAHSAAETIAARRLNALATDYDLVASSLFVNHPTVRFIAPKITSIQEWTATSRLPLTRDASRGVALVLDPLLTASVNDARRYYPLAEIIEYRPVISPTLGVHLEPALYEVRLTPDTLAAAQGVVARYFRGDNFEGKPFRQEAIRTLAHDWTKATNITGTYTLEFVSTLYVPQYSNYRFSLTRSAPLPPNAVELFINEEPIANDATAITLAKGNHALRLRAKPGAYQFELWWSATPSGAGFTPIPTTSFFRPPVMNNGLLGVYYRTPDWTGAPAFTQIDPEIAFYFHNLPLPRPYTVEWRGKLYAPFNGAYRFATESIDDSRLFINQQLLIENRSRNLQENVIQLTQGWHDIALRFADRTSYSRMYLYWSPPGLPREPLPARFLLPPMGRYPTPAEMAEAVGLSNVASPGAPPARAPSGFNVGAANLMTLTPVGSIGAGQLKNPHGLAVTPERVYIADTGNRRLQVLDLNNNLIATVDGGANSAEKFVEPFDVAITTQGHLLVLDSDDGWIYRFDAAGQYLGRFAGPAAQFYKPRGMSVDANDFIYIADTGGARVVKLSPTGERLQIFGAKGTGRGQFGEVGHVAVDAEGFLFAMDLPNKRVNVFAPDGRFVLDFPIPLAIAFNSPHIAFLPDQSLLITAPEQGVIQHYTRDGRLLGQWGGVGDGAQQLRIPTALGIKGNTIWVADTGNHRIQVWEFK